jgi:hypothetical protein
MQPPAEAVVVRLGKTGLFEKALLRDAQKALDDPTVGRPEVSVFAAPPGPSETREDVEHRMCVEGGKYLRNLKAYRAADVGRMWEGNLFPTQEDHLPSGESPFHYNVDIGTVDDTAAERFFSTFGPESINKAWTK